MFEIGAGMNGQESVVILVSAVVLLLWLAKPMLGSFIALWRRKNTLRGMPTPPGAFPPLGHALILMRCVPWDKFCEWVKQYGPLVRVQIMHKDLVLIDEPKLLKQVFQTRMSKYSKDVGFSYYPFLPLLGTGLVTAEGQLWRKQRSMVSVHFRVEILDDIVGISKKAADRLSEKVEPLRNSGEFSCIAEEFRHLTLQVIGEAILSLSHEEADRVLPLLYLPIMEEANKRSLRPWREYIPNAEWFEHKKRIKALNDYIISILRKRWQKRYPKGSGKTALPAEDIVDRIMDDVARQGEWNRAVEKQLCYEIKTFMLAGHETSAAMLSWALYELTQNPECMKKVREEAERVFPNDDAIPTREEVSNMNYTYAVLKESLRKYSVVPVVTRVAKDEDELGGYKIPPGTTIGCMLQGVHHRPDIWPEPNKFDPQRFMEPNTVAPYTFLPFIDGPRNCLGQHLALIEGRVLLAYLVKKFKFKPLTDSEDEKHSLVVPIAPAKHMRMLIE